MIIIETEDWLTQSEAARQKGASRQSINNLVNRDRIRKIKISSITFVHKDDVKSFKGAKRGKKSK